jgi:hypothetical protein
MYEWRGVSGAMTAPRSIAEVVTFRVSDWALLDKESRVSESETLYGQAVREKTKRSYCTNDRERADRQKAPRA